MDAETSYDEWVAKNLSFISQHKSMIHLMKKIYIDGYNTGYESWSRNNAEIQLQK